MLKEICLIKIVLFLYALSVCSSKDYKSLKTLFLDKNSHTKRNINKNLNSFLKTKNYNNDNSLEFVPKQRKNNELMEQLRMVLTFVLTNPDYIIYLKNIEMPVYNIDLRLAEDLESDNYSSILRSHASSGKENDKKASDSSDSSEISDDNGKENLRYDSCERGRKKCVKACKSAYREVCYYETCYPSLRRKLRKMCKRSCRKWFS